MKIYPFTCCLLLSFNTFYIIAQNKNEKMEYAEQTTDTTESKLERRYNYLIRSHVEEKLLLKIGLDNLNYTKIDGLYDKIGFLYKISLEKKINPSWSFEIESGLRWSYLYTPSVKVSFLTIDYLKLGTRYYYNLQHKIAKGKSANNFSSDYITLHANMGNVFVPRGNGTGIFAGYGIQRRIGRKGYIDVSFGPLYDYLHNDFYLGHFNYSIGFGF